MFEDFFDYWFIIVLVIVFVIFFIVIISIASPKMRGKMMARQIKAAKYMLEEAEDDIRDISTKAASVTKTNLNTSHNDGFTSGPKFCKYCSEPIDNDSIYCKRCGKKQ